jgi:hypothetical protein
MILAIMDEDLYFVGTRFKSLAGYRLPKYVNTPRVQMFCQNTGIDYLKITSVHDWIILK